jgi:SAM-dependent methyltransferase
VDIAPEMIRLANEQRDAAGLANLSFAVSDYEALAFRDEFDAVVFFDALHHAEDEALAVRQAFAALKPGGLLLADEPGEGHSHAADSVAAVARYGVTEKDMPPARVVELGRAAGFTGFRVFPHAHELAAVVFTNRASPVPDPFAATDGAPENGPPQTALARLGRRLRFALDPFTPAPWRVTNIDHLLLHIRSNGLVLMRKGTDTARIAA